MQRIFEKITGSVTSAVEVKYTRFIELAPNITAAIAVFLFGWLLAEMVAHTIMALSKRLKLDFIAEKIGLEHFLKRLHSSHTSAKVIAKATKAYLIFVFFIESTKIAQMHEVADFLSQVNSYIPQLIIALFIMLVGIRIGNTTQSVISTSLSFTRSSTATVLGVAANYTILTFAVLAALAHLQIAEILIDILFIGFVGMLTIGGGLAFGLGGKDIVKELLESMKGREKTVHRKK